MAEIQKQDSLAEKASLQILQEGINAAKANVRKDTHRLEQSIDEASGIERIEACKYGIRLANGEDYGASQELGPQSGKKIWGFSPHIRPGAMIMQVKAPDIIDSVFNR